jgi:hypothetical protein
MTANPFAILLRNVPRVKMHIGGQHFMPDTQVLAALAAAVPADLAEAGKDAAWLRNIHGGHPDANRFDDVARNICALIATVTAQAAEIEGLGADYQRESDQHDETASALAAERAKVARLVKAAFCEGFAEGCDGTWVEGDYTPAWNKSESRATRMKAGK